MNFFGVNGAALNGGISKVVAGAALVIASSGFAAEGTRVILPDAAVVASSSATAVGTRTVFGDGGFVTIASFTGFPALLQLVSADIVLTSSLRAVNTEAYLASSGELAADGFITVQGGGDCAGVWTTTVEPLVTAAFASEIVSTSSGTADASVLLSGTSINTRDGYSDCVATSSMTADALRTALGYAQPSVESTFTADGIKIHGGGARSEAAWQISAIASIDTARSISASTLTADGLATRYSGAAVDSTFVLSCVETVTQYGVANVSVAAAIVANGRLGILGGGLFAVVPGVTADGILAQLGIASFAATSGGTASGTIVKLGEAMITCDGAVVAQGGLLVPGASFITNACSVTADGYSNAESLDPIERTMYRPFNDREMLRPFVDREMKRSA